ncbi:MAG: hypothetical protein K2P81_15885 [Bacteriovoracaceae bacterium]|nr:hypothetical protein [Bacteriovoracaceae bacterium]
MKGIPSGHDTPSIIWKALITGDDSGLPRSAKKAYFRQGLGHLFTPSGVHLATLNPVIQRFLRPGVIYFLLFLITQLTSGLAALSRVALTKCSSKAQTSCIVFAGILFIEGAAFSWRSNPISWCCSWMFLGICWFAPKQSRALWFFLAQLILCWIFNQQLALYSPLTNLLIALPMAFLFPLLLTFSLIPTFFIHSILLKIILWIHLFILKLDSLNSVLPAINPHAGHIILFICWIIFKRKCRFYLPLLLLILSSPLGNKYATDSSLSKWESTPTRGARIMDHNISKIRFSDGTLCRGSFRKESWKEICRPPKRRATNRL